MKIVELSSGVFVWTKRSREMKFAYILSAIQPLGFVLLKVLFSAMFVLLILTRHQRRSPMTNGTEIAKGKKKTNKQKRNK